jgi:hypothetical protein
MASHKCHGGKRDRGEVVAALDGAVDIKRLCAQATDTTRYPLLAGVDEYDDTYFNSRQAGRIVSELTGHTGVSA